MALNNISQCLEMAIKGGGMHKEFHSSVYCLLNSDASTASLLKTEYVLEGGSATAPSVPEREGYNFTGWDVTFDYVTTDITTTAQFAEKVYHTVNFYDWDTTLLKTQQVEHGKNATAPDVPVRDGYRFIGWDI